MLTRERGTVAPWSTRFTTTRLLELSTATTFPLNHPFSLLTTTTCPTSRLLSWGGTPPTSCSSTAARYLSTTYQ